MTDDEKIKAALAKAARIVGRTAGMDANIARIHRNLQKMADMNAPEADIEGYLAEEGFTGDQFKAALKTGRMPESPASSALAGAGQGAMFGFGDELVGAGSAAGNLIGLGREGETPRDAYIRARDYARAVDDQARLTNPKSSIGGEVAGAIASALATGGAGLGARGAVTAAEAPALLKAYGALGGAKALGKTAAIAGAQGAAQGLGASRATDVGGAAVDTALGGILGAGAGAAGHTLAGTVNRMLPVDRAIQAIRSMVTPKELKTALNASRAAAAPPLIPNGRSGVPLAEVNPRLRSMVAPAAESNPRAAEALLPGANARAETQLSEEALQLRGASGDAQAAMNEQLKAARREFANRAADVRSRAQADIASAQENAALATQEARIGAADDVGSFISDRDATKLREALTRLQRQRGGTLYRAATEAQETGTIPQGLRGAAAMREAVDLANKRFGNIRNPATGQFGDMRVNPDAITPRDAQVIDQALRDMSTVSPTADAIAKGNARNAGAIADEFKAALDQQFPKLAKANQFYAGRAAELDALDMGGKALAPSRSASDIAMEFNKLSPGQQKAYRSGIASAVRQQIDNGADPLSLFGKEAMLDKLRVAGGNDAFATSIGRRNRAIQEALDQVETTKTAASDMVRNERALAAEALAGKRADARGAYKDALAKAQADIEAARTYDAVGLRNELQRGVDAGVSKRAGQVINNPINNAATIAGGIGGVRGFGATMGLGALGRKFPGQQAKSKMILDAVAGQGTDGITGLLGKGVERARIPRGVGLLGGALYSSPAISTDAKKIGALSPIFLYKLLDRMTQSKVAQAAGNAASMLPASYKP